MYAIHPRSGRFLGPILAALIGAATTAPATTFWSENFETAAALTNWSASNGTWQIGIPTSGPGSAHGGTRGLATVLDGNYPRYADSRMIGPNITVPSIDQNPRLQFWHWWSTWGLSEETATVQIKEVGTSTWKDLSPNYANNISAIWTQASLDLSAYAGKTLQIAFYFKDNGTDTDWPNYTPTLDSGWYIDDLAVVTGTPHFNNPENFENGQGDWIVTNSVWQVGTPTSGPNAAHGGTKCLATILGGNYPRYLGSQMISPSFVVPAITASPRLQFWHWWSTWGLSEEIATVQIKEVGTSTWKDLSPNYANNVSAIWTQASLDLGTYAGKTVQIAFYFKDNGADTDWPNYTPTLDSGWYIDDLAVVTGTPHFNNPENFENGQGDWIVTNSVWQVGTPTSGPNAAHGGTKCLATILGGNYPRYLGSQMISPSFVVPAITASPRLQFWHWWSTWGLSEEIATVQIKEVGTSTWKDLSPNYANNVSAIWTQASLDLGTYAGKTVQIAFYFKDNGADTDWPNYTPTLDSGWYIDDLAVVTGTPHFNNPENFENGQGDWVVTNSVWQVGTPTSGPNAAHGGTKCLATILGGNYPRYLGSHAILPPFTVPSALENPKISFWHWWSVWGTEQGYVQIREVGATAWTNLGGNYASGSSGGWTRASLVLSAYAGKTVQIAFYFMDDGGDTDWPSFTPTLDSGWYLDDVAIEVTSMNSADFPNRTVVENHPLTITTSTTLANPVFSIQAPVPAGMTINPTTGQIDWTPSEAQGPGYYPITVELRQTGNTLDPVDSVSFDIQVLEENNAPVMAAIPNQTVALGGSLNLPVNATDLDSANTTTRRRMLPRADFEDLTLGLWTAYSVASNKNWEATEYDGRYAEMFGYGANVASEDWLISPVLNLDQFTGETLTFLSRKQYTGPALDVLYSTNYSGTGNPNVATWTSLTAACQWPLVANSWTSSGTVNLSAITGTTVRIAFRYKSTGTTNSTAAMWDIDNIDLIGTSLVVTGNTDIITYSLAAGYPLGMTINPTTGVITWTPSAGQTGDFIVTVRATDNGSPALLSEVSFKVTVGSNTPPVLTLPTLPSAIDELAAFTFTATATDADHNTLTFSLDAPAPEGMAIDASTGVLTWTPTELQGPSSYTVTVRVTDDGSPNLSDTKDFTVTVSEVNVAPVLTLPTLPPAISEMVAFTFEVAATDADLPVNTLTYSLDAGAPVGMAIGASTGVLTWTPTELQGPGPYTVTVRVADNGTPNLSDTESFTVTVSEVNVAPVLTLPTLPPAISEMVAFTFEAVATDADLPVNTLTYSLDAGAPEGMAIGASTGVLTWTPTEHQGPAPYTITVRVTDNGTPNLSDTESITVTVAEVNLAPVLAPIPNQTGDSGATITLTAAATDPDLPANTPANTLAFSLGDGAPAGASIDPGSGAFIWTTPLVADDMTYSIRIIVTDNGTPALTDDQLVTFAIRGEDDNARWRRTHFGSDVDNPAKEAAVWGDFADPDRDGTANILEFMMARNPKVADPDNDPSFRVENGYAIMTFRETKDTQHGILLFGSFSGDLRSWNYAGIEYLPAVDHGDHNLREIRVRTNRQRNLFQRLEAFRIF